MIMTLLVQLHQSCMNAEQSHLSIQVQVLLFFMCCQPLRDSINLIKKVDRGLAEEAPPSLASANYVQNFKKAPSYLIETSDIPHQNTYTPFLRDVDFCLEIQG